MTFATELISVVHLSQGNKAQWLASNNHSGISEPTLDLDSLAL